MYPGGPSGGFSTVTAKRITRTTTGYEVNIAAVPEPGSLLLLATGGGLLALRRRRTRASS